MRGANTAATVTLGSSHQLITLRGTPYTRLIVWNTYLELILYSVHMYVHVTSVHACMCRAQS